MEVMTEVFWDIMPFWAATIYWKFTGVWCLNIKDLSSSLLYLECLDPEDGGNKLLWNVINCESGWSHSTEDLNTLYLWTPQW